MAAFAQPSATGTQKPARSWLANFFLQELRPYPGRTATVVRMTVAATLIMLWIMTFRIPGAALGAYYSLLFSRDSPHATLRSALTSVSAVACALVFILVGVLAMLGDPFLHFAWVCITLLVVFFLISSLTAYNAGTAFGFLTVNTLTSWDFPARTELRVENTLWTALAVLTSAAITVTVEFIYQQLNSTDLFALSINDRILTVERVLRCRADGIEPAPQLRSKVEQYATTGTSLLRRILLRSLTRSDDRAELSALVTLVGRLVDLVAASFGSSRQMGNEERMRCGRAADALHQVHLAVTSRSLATLADLPVVHRSDNPQSLLDEIESTLARIPEICAGLVSLAEFAPRPIELQRAQKLFKPDAFTSTSHLLFALKGTLAATVCYFLYNAIAWRGLSTAVATCMITALTTIGASRQKQSLRFAGAVLGSVVFGMTAQIFALPYLDGIGGFAVLFVIVTLISSWIATSSPRLSYFGVQTAFAFYVTHLAAFGPQTSLAVARNDVCGIMLGLAVMWLIFDRLWAKEAATDLLDSMARNIRHIARLERFFEIPDLQDAPHQIQLERATISDDFDAIRNDADALLFEIGRGWQEKVTLRNQVRMWQPQIRTYLFIEIGLTHFRQQLGQGTFPPQALNEIKQSNRIVLLLADLLDRQVEDKANKRAKLQQALAETDSARLSATPAEVPLADLLLRTARELAFSVLATKG